MFISASQMMWMELKSLQKVHWGEMSGGGGGREVLHSGCSAFGSVPPLQSPGLLTPKLLNIARSTQVNTIGEVG